MLLPPSIPTPNQLPNLVEITQSALARNIVAPAPPQRPRFHVFHVKKKQVLIKAPPAPPKPVDGLTATQMQYAGDIVWEARALGVPVYGQEIGVATAMQESKLLDLNYGDLDSLGLFQQRPMAGWGTPSQVTNPWYAAGAFFQALKQVPGWWKMSLTVAAQAVQHSGFPDAYAQWGRLAHDVVASW